MKRLLYAIRMWLLSLLHDEPEECTEKTKAAYLDYIREQRRYISILEETIVPYKNAIREICDWCCDVCACNCDKRNGWCSGFEPVHYEK